MRENGKWRAIFGANDAAAKVSHTSNIDIQEIVNAVVQYYIQV